jgi:two-component system sensor histidine kinase BarA
MNAVKYTFSGSITLKASLTDSLPYIDCQKDTTTVTEDNGGQKFLKVSVEDTGIGISQKDSPHLFKIFSKIKFKNNISQNGFGIGLAVSKRITEEMGGLL